LRLSWLLRGCLWLSRSLCLCRTAHWMNHFESSSYSIGSGCADFSRIVETNQALGTGLLGVNFLMVCLLSITLVSISLGK
jgi:hypothetical protein